MSDTQKPAQSPTQLSNPTATLPNPWQCLGGAVVALAIAFVLYGLTGTIAHYFAVKGVHTGSLIVQRLSAAIRTLIIGLSALGTGIFGLAGLGLFGLGIQLLIQGGKGGSLPPDNS